MQKIIPPPFLCFLLILTLLHSSTFISCQWTVEAIRETEVERRREKGSGREEGGWLGEEVELVVEWKWRG